jgi:hypothetical protein
MTLPSPNIRVLYYHFTPEEVLALYKFFEHEYVNPKNMELISVINHLCKIVDTNEFPSGNHQTT